MYRIVTVPRVAKQCRNRGFGEAEVVCYAGVAVAQDARRNACQRGAGKNLVPVLRKADERFSFDRAGKDRTCRVFWPARIEEIDHRKADRANRRALLAVGEAQAAAIVRVHLRPDQRDVIGQQRGPLENRPGG